MHPSTRNELMRAITSSYHFILTQSGGQFGEILADTGLRILQVTVSTSTVYGRIAAGKQLAAGTYSDTVTVQLTY